MGDATSPELQCTILQSGVVPQPPITTEPVAHSHSLLLCPVKPQPGAPLPISGGVNHTRSFN